jgi:hypothetical protein
VKVIFLDIDGVLNDHRAQCNGYCGICPQMVDHLNSILQAVPDAEIVVSSAWRYCVHNGHSTVEGLEHLLLTHGVDCAARVDGVTDADPATYSPGSHLAPFDVEWWKEQGLKWRKSQILSYVCDHEIERFVILDDLPLDLPELVQTSAQTGLTAELAAEVVKRLTEEPA